MAYYISHKNMVENENRIYYFKKDIVLPRCHKFVVHVAADARYKLFVNGSLAAVGPCKGCERERYYDEVDIAPYLKEGENRLFAEVLQLNISSENKWDSKLLMMVAVYRSGMALFGLSGKGYDERGREIASVITDENWQVSKESGICFSIETEDFFANIFEEIKEKDYCKGSFQPAVCAYPFLMYEESKLNFGALYPVYAKKSPIPMMFFGEKRALMPDEDGVCDAGQLTNAYVTVKCQGKGTVKMTYAECYCFIENGRRKKYDRTDKNGVLLGMYDLFELDDEEETIHQFFWFRTFRYIGIKTTGDAVVKEIIFSETGYPMKQSLPYDFGVERDNRLFEISKRTLECCMQETYVDCPYYEQLQYAMDTFLQMEYTYQLTTDDRLPRRAINDFALSQNADGMLMARFPAGLMQIIPSFSIYFIRMLDSHYRRFGDVEFIRRYLRIADGVLEWHRTQLGENGLLRQSLYWNFCDWAQAWKGSRGEVPVSKGETITIQNLMYAAALKIAANLQEAIGRKGLAKEYFERYKRIKDVVNTECYSAEEELYGDGNLKKSFSQQTQIWAVLSGVCDMNRARKIMEKSFSLSAQATFCYAYDLFRALEIAGIYEKRNGMMEQLYELEQKNCTTIPETTGESPRSECHGWGAVAIYELTTMDLGIREINIPNQTLLIRPYINDRCSAMGSVPTILGTISVKWEKKNGEFTIEISSPCSFTKTLYLPNGEKVIFTDKYKQTGCLLLSEI